jgi:antitoxin MazE
MIRRLFKTGNSTVLSLPKEILEYLGLKDGQNVNLELDRKKKRLILTSLNNASTVPGVDEEFAHQVNEFIEEYRSALDDLSE